MPADTQPLHDLLRHRWSPRNYTPQPVPDDTLRSLFEAARWTASCFNEQPWAFVVATQAQPDDFARVLECLVPKNQEWAKNAWAIGITAGKKTFAHNNSPNRYALHDTGAAFSSLALQATALGVFVHEMGGFDHEKARTLLGIPETYELGAAFTIGCIDGPPEPPATRSRRPVEEFVLKPGWVPSSLVTKA